MTAAEVKEAVRRRYPAIDGPMVGQWTCVEEYLGIDLLAVSAWASNDYRRIDHQVKISRSDFRRELLKPRKRSRATAWCHEFYFVVPVGLLRDEELAYREPEWEPIDFVREPCIDRGGYGHGGGCWKGKRRVQTVGPLEQARRIRPTVEVDCDSCGGKGYMALSRVEREAPTLWIPRDVGLLTVRPDGVFVTRKAPIRRADRAERALDHQLAQIMRHASAKPDPRHAALGT